TAFREHVRRMVGIIDQLMITIIAEQSGGPTRYRVPDWVENSPLLKGLGLQISLVGPDGMVRASNLPLNGPVDVADRDHFRYQLGPSAAQPYISVPVRGRVSGKWSIQLTRRITGADGKFAGVVVISVDPFYFSQFFESADLGRHGAVRLVGLDGVVR